MDVWGKNLKISRHKLEGVCFRMFEKHHKGQRGCSRDSEGTVSGDEMRRAERRHQEGAGVTVQNNTRTSVRISALIVSEARVRLSVEECRDLTYN